MKAVFFYERKKGTASAVRLYCSSNQDGSISASSLSRESSHTIASNSVGFWLRQKRAP
ncbi:MAG: hypothetical protein J6L23_00350 [Clostridia bacterium]|nr:hypothetical protein [Clostridia bacterium]MBQ6906181.1 hypothetical protein [Clostridia bacterium]